jgi:hypothetical protein
MSFTLITHTAKELLEKKFSDEGTNEERIYNRLRQQMRHLRLSEFQTNTALECTSILRDLILTLPKLILQKKTLRQIIKLSKQMMVAHVSSNNQELYDTLLANDYLRVGMSYDIDYEIPVYFLNIEHFYLLFYPDGNQVSVYIYNVIYRCRMNICYYHLLENGTEVFHV